MRGMYDYACAGFQTVGRVFLLMVPREVCGHEWVHSFGRLHAFMHAVSPFHVASGHESSSATRLGWIILLLAGSTPPYVYVHGGFQARHGLLQIFSARFLMQVLY